MQDFTGVPAVVDLAAMRDAMEHLGGDPKKINPLVPVDLVIDHSVAVNFFGHKDSFKKNVEEEYKQNQERYRFLKWAQGSFEDFRVVPPGTGICHQVNLEYLSQTVWTAKTKISFPDKSVATELAYPDTLVGTDSHTTMVNGLSVLGWGVGGIEAEAAMLGQPYSMLLPEVIGVRLNGKLKEGVTATDLVLTVTQMLRKRGVVGKFVEYFGPGLANLTIADRATLGNMAPEYGATCGFFPIDDDTIRYLRDTGRSADRVALVIAYAKAQGMYRTKSTPDPIFTDVLKLELSSIEPSLAGPKRPQDRVALKEVKSGFAQSMDKEFSKAAEMDKRVPVEGRNHTLGNGDVVIAAITSCTNTSNPSVMIAAGLARPEGGGERAHGEAVGEDLARARLAGGRGISGEIRPAERSRRARLQSRRLRLHHLHRQFRPAAGGDFRSDQQERSGGRRGAVRQSQFRRPRQCRRARQLSRFAAAGRRLCARRLDADRRRQAAARHRPERPQGLSARYLAVEPRDRRRRPQEHQQADVPAQIRRRVQGRRQLAQDRGARAA